MTENLSKSICCRSQRSCGQGYVFTRVCDSVNTGGGVSASVHAGIPPPPPEQTPPVQTHPRSRPPPPEQTHPRSRHTLLPEAHTGIRSMSGRYASYWNAFFNLFSHGKSEKMSNFINGILVCGLYQFLYITGSLK